MLCRTGNKLGKPNRNHTFHSIHRFCTGISKFAVDKRQGAGILLTRRKFGDGKEVAKNRQSRLGARGLAFSSRTCENFRRAPAKNPNPSNPERKCLNMQAPAPGSLLDLTARQMVTAGMTLGQCRNELWRQIITITLKENRANLCSTARALRIHRNTLNRLIINLKLRDRVEEAKGIRRAGWRKNAAPKRLDQSRVDPRAA